MPSTRWKLLAALPALSTAMKLSGLADLQDEGRSMLQRQPLAPDARDMRTQQPDPQAVPNATNATNATKPTYRVAVLNAGTLQRYWVDPIPQYLIKPLVQEGHAADYFLALNTEHFTPWQSHARSFVLDPAIASLAGPNGVVEADLLDLLNASIRKAGGTLRCFKLYADLSALAGVIHDFDRRATGWNRGCGERTTAARSNALKLFWEMEDLWRQIVDAEAMAGRYDFIITQRDDSFWLRPFSLDMLLAASPETSAVEFKSDPPVEAFNLRCLIQFSTFDANAFDGFNDYTLILRREVARPFGMLYSRLVGNRGYWGLANLEAFLKRVAAEESVTFAHMAARVIPVQRAGRLLLHKGMRTCLHKVCDSAAAAVERLDPLSRMPSCASLAQSWCRSCNRSREVRRKARGSRQADSDADAACERTCNLTIDEPAPGCTGGLGNESCIVKEAHRLRALWNPASD